MTVDGAYRISVVKTTGLVRTCREKHNLSLLSTVLLGRALTGTTLLAANLKGEERIQLKMEGNGPAGALTAEASSHGEVRGYIINPHAEIDLDQEEKLGDGLGVGVLSVSKILYNKARPVTGTVELKRGNINEDLAHYLLQSEQVPSAVSLDVALDAHGEVSDAGGVLVQAMPGATKERTLQLEENIRTMPQIGEQLATGYLGDVLKRVANGLAVKELARYPVDFFCRCSKKQFEKSLGLVNPDELLVMNGDVEELVCHYCNNTYKFTRDEIEAIARKRRVRLN